VTLCVDSDKWQDVNVVSSLLKLFFRKLPESLITDGELGIFSYPAHPCDNACLMSAMNPVSVYPAGLGIMTN